VGLLGVDLRPLLAQALDRGRQSGYARRAPPLGLTREQLAQRIGPPRETVTTILNDLTHKGVIDDQNNSYSMLLHISPKRLGRFVKPPASLSGSSGVKVDTEFGHGIGLFGHGIQRNSEKLGRTNSSVTYRKRWTSRFCELQWLMVPIRLIISGSQVRVLLGPPENK